MATSRIARFSCRFFAITFGAMFHGCLLPVTLGATPAPKVAVLNFNHSGPRQTFVADACRHQANRMLLDSGKFDVISPEDVERIVSNLPRGAQEKDFFQTLRDELGCQYVLYGDVLLADVTRNRFAGYGVVSDKLKYRVEADVKVVNMFDGRVVFGRKLGGGSERVHLGGASGEDSGEFLGIVKTAMQSCSQPMLNALKEDILKGEAALNTFGAETPTPRQTLVPSPAEIKQGRVTFFCNVDRAPVEVNGVIEGATNEALIISEGLHEVVVRAKGFEDLHTKIRVRGNQVSEIQIELKPSTGMPPRHRLSTTPLKK